jgi:hypothetical protein
MHFVFETIVDDCEFYNFSECPDVNDSGIKRFTSSPLVSTMICFRASNYQIFKEFAKTITYSTTIPTDYPYIIATGVAHCPDEWCGHDDYNRGLVKLHPHRSSLFSHLKPEYLKDLQSGKAMLLIDQSHEGYQTVWLWSWFHSNCELYGINPDRIIYITGNLDAKNDYTNWADQNNLLCRMVIAPHPHFELMIYETGVNLNFNREIKLPKFQEQLEYKKSNLENIKLYNALQKRVRAHRAWLFKALVDANLLDDGINSMNKFYANDTFLDGRHMTHDQASVLTPLTPILPPENPADHDLNRFASGDSGGYLAAVNEHTALDTWVSVISEASYGDNDGTCFISEKSFKPILCYHPFIIFGNKGSLAYLRSLGYKTFSPFIDESYDELSTWERLDAIINAINKIKLMTASEKLKWYEGMQDILEHNYKILQRNSSQTVPIAMQRVYQHFKDASHV